MTTLALCVFALAQIPDGGIVVVETQGQGKGLNEAMEDGARNALRQVVDSMPAYSALAKSLLIEDHLYSHVSGLVRSVDELDTRRTASGDTRVKVRVEVRAQKLDERLAELRALMERFGDKRVVVCIEEQGKGPGGKDGLRKDGPWTVAIADALRRDGWQVLSWGDCLSDSPSAEDVERVARELHAQLLVRGRITYTRGPLPDDTMIPATDAKGRTLFSMLNADCRIQAVNVSDMSERLVVQDPLANMVDGSYSPAETERQMAAKAAPKIASKLREGLSGEAPAAHDTGELIRVTLSGATAERVATVEKQLRIVSNVRDVKPGQDVAKGAQLLEVRYAGTAQQLAAALSKLTAKLTVTRVSAGVIEATLR